jgi:hypothetical protein
MILLPLRLGINSVNEEYYSVRNCFTIRDEIIRLLLLSDETETDLILSLLFFILGTEGNSKESGLYRNSRRKTKSCDLFRRL